MVISIGRNPSKRDELLRYAFIGFSLVEVSGLIGLVMSFLLLFGFTIKETETYLLFKIRIATINNSKLPVLVRPI